MISKDIEMNKSLPTALFFKCCFIHNYFNTVKIDRFLAVNSCTEPKVIFLLLVDHRRRQ